MIPKFKLEDFGNFRRLYAYGPHKHNYSKNQKICNECYADLNLSYKFLRQMLNYDAPGIFQFIETRLSEAYNAKPKQAIKRFYQNLNGYVVLDFGSGLGTLTPFFFEYGADLVILSEIDEKLLALSRNYLEDSGYIENCKYLLIKENDELSMLKDESIDLIVASEVFEHILANQRKTTLTTLYSKLKPGGTIIITAPNRFYPKDNHTTGLWFAAWLPPTIGAFYARQFASRRWEKWSTEALLRQGLRQFSYFESKRYLKPLGATDLCLKYPFRRGQLATSLKGRLLYGVLDIIFSLFSKYIGPWEAWQPDLKIAWSKPTT